MQQRRMLRAELDAMPDVAVDGTELAFAQRFATVTDDEPFFTAPDAFVASCRALLDADVVDTVPRLVHDTICVRIGCNRVPLFALVSGGRDRTLYVFRCVYAGCAAFLDVRRFLGADKIKLNITYLSLTHTQASANNERLRSCQIRLGNAQKRGGRETNSFFIWKSLVNAAHRRACRAPRPAFC